MDVLIDIGGTKIVIATSSKPGTLDRVERFATPEAEPLEKLCEWIRDIAPGEISGIGIGLPGPFSRPDGMTLEPVNLSPPWHNLHLRDELSDRFCCPVAVENDANCAALAEARFGAGAGHDLVVYYTISTGVGTGVVYHGSLLYGRHDTEGGHQVLAPRELGGTPCSCGGYGCLEALIGGNSLARLHGKPAHELMDPAIWEEAGRWLGMAITNTTVLLDPNIIIIGGGLTSHWDAIEPEMRRTMEELIHLHPLPTVVLERLGETQTLLGAQCALANASSGLRAEAPLRNV